MRCNVETHTLIVNEVCFFELNVILHPQIHHDSSGKNCGNGGANKKEKEKKTFRDTHTHTHIHHTHTITTFNEHFSMQC